MTTFDWNCRTVDVYPTDEVYTDVVYNVHWIVTGTSDQLDPQGEPQSITVNNIGTQTLSTSDITDFIPFEDLTNEEVVAWTQAAMGEEQVAQIEANIEAQIENIITPTSLTLTIGEPIPPA
jgi:hypothetical protein